MEVLSQTNGNNISTLPQTPTQTWSTQYPLSESFGRSTPSISQSWPLSEQPASRPRIVKHMGHSASEQTVVHNVIIRVWSGGEHEYHNEIKEGNALFIMSGLVSSTEVAQVVLNIRHVNQWLADYYRQGMNLMTKTVPNRANPREPAIPLIVERGILSQADFNTLTQLNTAFWANFPAIDAARKDNKKRQVAHVLEYLFEEGTGDRWNFYGFAKGQLFDVPYAKTSAVSRGSVVDSIENYWGDTVQPGQQLFFIFKRYLDPDTGNYTHFAFHPYHGFNDPTLNDLLYIDVTGHVRYGRALRIGKLVRWVEDFTYDQDYLNQLVGFKPLKRDYLKASPSPGTIRVILSCPPGRRGMRWLA